MTHRLLTPLAIVLALAGTANAQLIPRCTSAKRVCCLKDYGYRGSTLSAPASASTFGAILSRSSGTLETASWNDIKSFQLEATSLQKDHCEIADVSLVIRRSGTGTVRFQVRHDPNLVDEVNRPKFVRYQRSGVNVTLRFIVVDKIGTPSSGRDRVVGPAIEVVQLPTIWVQQFETSNQMFHINSEMCQRHFDQIERVEFDLQYE